MFQTIIKLIVKNMDEKGLTGKESLELITRMIQETQNNVARYAAYPLLIWGYLTVAISIVVWAVISEYQYGEINYLWWLLPLVAFPLTIYFSRKGGKRGVVTYMDPDYQPGLVAVWEYRFSLVDLCFLQAGRYLFPDPFADGYGSDAQWLCRQVSPHDRGGLCWDRSLIFTFVYTRCRPIVNFRGYLCGHDDCSRSSAEP